MSICTLTDTAKQQITTICNENEVYAVTLNLKGGGCAGFEYDWATYKTADELLDDDTIIYGSRRRYVCCRRYKFNVPIWN